MADLGDTLRFTSDLYADDGNPTNAPTVTLTVTLPDGTTATPTVTNPPSTTGQYLYDYVTTVGGLPGRYTGRWLFSFAGGATTSYVQSFDVGLSMITVDEAIRHLRATDTITSEPDREQVSWLCQVATDAVERDLGRVFVPRTFTETFDGGSSAIFLRVPVLSVASVTVDGVAETDTLINKEAGILRRQYSTWSWAYGYQNVTVTYTAGTYDPPLIARKVALNTVQGMWQSSQQSPLGMLDESSEEPIATVTGGLNPLEMRAYESLRVPGIA